jgi:hypothetical protein
MARCVLLRSVRSTPIGNNTLTIRTFPFSPQSLVLAAACTASFCVLFFYRPTGRPRRTSMQLECHRKTINGRVPFQARGFPPVTEEQNRPSSLQSGGVEDQPGPQYPGLWHRGSLSARSFSRSPSPPPPLLSHNVLRDGQTSPLRPQLVVSRSTCPPLFPSLHANSFVIGTAVIHTHCGTLLTCTEICCHAALVPVKGDHMRAR